MNVLTLRNSTAPFMALVLTCTSMIPSRALSDELDDLLNTDSKESILVESPATKAQWTEALTQLSAREYEKAATSYSALRYSALASNTGYIVPRRRDFIDLAKRVLS